MVSSGEKTLWEGKPSKKIIWKWTILKSFVLLAIFAVFFFLSSPLLFGGSPVLLIVILPVLAFAGWNYFLWKTYEYRLTDKNAYFKGGILLKKQSIVPFFKITNLPNTQDVLDQVLGFTTVGIQTAGTGGQPFPEVSFEGLVEPDAVTEILKSQIEKSRKSSVRTGSE